MSLYKDASLVMLPSAVKDGKLYSIRPTDGAGDFTFSRGSNLAATRVDVNGLIEKGRENVLLQSNGFNTWISNNTSETSGQNGYDGLSNAWLLSKSAASAYLYVNNSLSGVQTFSIYAKSGSLSWIRIVILGASDFADAFFNLGDGSIGTNSGLISSNSENIGGGWYRYSLVLNGSPSQVRIYPADFNGNVSGTSGNILIQDAQRELGLVATPYIETGASTAQGGILEDLPRLDYSGGASCPSLLLEPQRTNLITQSEYFDAWLYKADVTLTTNTTETKSPTGDYNATKLVENSVNQTHRVFESQAGNNNMLSFFAKAAERDWVCVLVANGNYNFFNVANGTKGVQQSGSPSTIEPYGNGWYRISVYNFHNSYALIGLAESDYVQSYQGDGTSGAYIFGAQVENSASYPTSYIPTMGSAVTRSEDSAITASSDLISTQAFTMFFEHKALGIIGTSWAYALEMDDGSDEIEFYVNGGFGMNIYLGGNGGYIFGASSNDGYRAGLTSKVALSYDGDKLSYFINGSLYNSATGVSFSDVNTYLNFRGSRNIALKQSLVFPTALTDSECIALTTI